MDVSRDTNFYYSFLVLPTEKRRLFSNDDFFAPSVNYDKTFIGVTKGMLNHRDLEYHVLIPSQH